jgi:hypothetical protein
MEDVDGDDEAGTTVDWADNTSLSRRIEIDKVGPFCRRTVHSDADLSILLY